MDEHVVSANAHNEPQDPTNAGGLFKSVQSVISFALGSVALLTASGFIIVNVYLSEFTNIQGYSITTGQYVAASVGALFFTGVATIVLVMPAMIVGAALGTNFDNLLLIVKHLLHQDLEKERPVLSLTKDFLRVGVVSVARLNLKHLLNTVRGFSFLVLTILCYSFVYGGAFYGQIAHYLGGGAPVTINVILKDKNDIASFGFTALPAHSNIPAHIELLAELSDGILVYDTQHQFAVAIKSDAIEGIADANADLSLPATAIPEATQAPTAEATPR